MILQPEVSAAEALIVALDFPSRKQALEFVDSLEGQCRWFKVGLELFCAEGPRFVEELRSRNFKVFLDLKLHDIPNTVGSAVRALGALQPSLLTVHALGGPRMLAAAREAAESFPTMRLLAVTVLTSLHRGELEAVGIQASPAEEVVRLGQVAIRAGIPGLVCSPEEIVTLRQELGAGPTLVVPGIRPDSVRAGVSQKDDQQRTSTPAEAISRGASKIVVGRPITRAEHPARAAEGILAEIRIALRQGPDAQNV